MRPVLPVLRHLAPLLAICAVALSGCASLPFIGGRDGDTAQPPPAAPAADAPAGGTPDAPARPAGPAAPDGSPDSIDPADVAVPEQPGILSRLAGALGANDNTPNVGPCPSVRILYDSSRFVQLTGPERFENVGFTGEINGTQSSCRYFGTNPITVELALEMAFGKGPRAAGPTTQISYWVAVIQVVRTTDPVTGQVVNTDIGPLVKERFTQSISFESGSDRIAMVSPVTTVTIPRASERISGSNFEVLVGFELTPEQLQFNRDGKRFRVDAGVPR
jgi:hypothetical protein